MVTANYSKRQKSIELNKKQNWQQTNKKKILQTPHSSHPCKKPIQTQQQRRETTFSTFLSLRLLDNSNNQILYSSLSLTFKIVFSCISNSIFI